MGEASRRTWTTFTKVVSALRTSGKLDLDIEYLGNRVEDLAERGRLDPFIEAWGSDFDIDPQIYRNLRRQLVQSVLSLTFVDDKTPGYERNENGHLAGLMCPNARRRVVSLNYDNVVELAAARRQVPCFLRVSYEKGVIRWVDTLTGKIAADDNDEVEQTGTIRLYKLHGSTTLRFVGHYGTESSVGVWLHTYWLIPQRPAEEHFGADFGWLLQDYVEYNDSSVIFGGVGKMGSLGRLLGVYVES